MGVTLLGCFSILRLEVIKFNFENSYETRMGLVLLVRRDEIYRLSLVRLQSDCPKMGVTLLSCFVILRFEITKIIF